MNTSSRAKAVIYMVALFAAGAVFGAFTLRHFTPPPPPAPQPLKLGRADEIRTRINDRLKSKLNLTPDQLVKAEPLIKQAAQNLEDAHAQCLIQIDHAIVDLHKSMLPFLTGPQLSLMQQIDAAHVDSMFQKYGYRASTNANPSH